MKSIFFAFCAVCLCAPVFAEDEGLEEEETSETVEKVTVSENNKKKKAQILALCRLPADYSSAGKWFKLAKGIEADGLRQLALKACWIIVNCQMKDAKVCWRRTWRSVQLIFKRPLVNICQPTLKQWMI